MLTRLAGGHVIDPVNDRDGTGDVWIRDGRIVAPPPRETRADTTYDVSGKIVMAGGIDIHSHIAGANVNTARLLLPEYHHASRRRPEMTPLADAGWTTFATGSLYARMGFKPCCEFAPYATMPPHTIAASLFMERTIGP